MTPEPGADPPDAGSPEDAPDRAAARVERELVFQPEFLEDLTYWVATDRRTALKVLQLVTQISRDPFTGTGRPEQLKYLDPHTWSRRITQEHRLVYLVSDDRIDFLQARYHY